MKYYYVDNIKYAIDIKNKKIINELNLIKNINVLERIIIMILTDIKYYNRNHYSLNLTQIDYNIRRSEECEQFLNDLCKLITPNILNVLLINDNIEIRDLARKYYNKLVG